MAACDCQSSLWLHCLSTAGRTPLASRQMKLASSARACTGHALAPSAVTSTGHSSRPPRMPLTASTHACNAAQLCLSLGMGKLYVVAALALSAVAATVRSSRPPRTAVCASAHACRFRCCLTSTQHFGMLEVTASESGDLGIEACA